jgi:hypothetical protein
MATEILYPFGAAQDVTIAATGETAITIIDTAYNSVIPTLTGNATLTVTKGSQLRAGAKLSLVIKTTATETFTFAGDIVAPVVTGVAGKTWAQAFVFNGTKFYPAGAKIQVD